MDFSGCPVAPVVCRSPQDFTLVLFLGEKGGTQIFLHVFNRSLIILRCCRWCSDNIPGPGVSVRKAAFVGEVDGNQTVKGHE